MWAQDMQSYYTNVKRDNEDDVLWTLMKKLYFKHYTEYKFTLHFIAIISLSLMINMYISCVYISLSLKRSD